MSLKITHKSSDLLINENCDIAKKMSIFDALKQLSKKIKILAKLYFESVIFKASILSFFTFSFFVSYLVLASSMYLLSTIISSVALAILIKRNSWNFIYEISTADGYIRQIISKKRWPWFNQITDNIYLGALPLKNLEHEKIFREKNITSVLSLVETKETTKKTIFTSPIDISYWKKNQYSHLQISTKDRCPISSRDLHKAADFIHQRVLENKKIYVHCVAGRSRSAMAVISYLVKYKNIPLTQALRFVKEKRRVLYINSSQRKCLFNWYQNLTL